MSGPRLAIAAGSRLGTEAAANVARHGGNAVDACLASAIMAWVAEPFFASVTGSGFIAIRTPDGAVEVIDGNNAMPHTKPLAPGQGIKRVFLDYSNGMYTGIGGGSVGVPGILAAIRAAWERHGRIEWDALFEDAIRAAREGIAFPRTSAYYLSVTWDPIWSLYPSSKSTFSIDGRPLVEGELLIQEELAGALELIAAKGADVVYSGSLGREIADAVAADDGFLGLQDLESYRAAIRPPITTEVLDWRIESNPPPAVGGAVLVHMLALLDEGDLEDEAQRTRALVGAQSAAMSYRSTRYQSPDGIAAAFDEALGSLGKRSDETTHTSSADADGYACSLTESNGYGAGLSVHGILLNNSLGEEELNPLGTHSLPPGSRCHSNMAPTIATGPTRTVALGSPGADRIVSAIVQTLLRIAVDGDTLADAVAAPRIYLDPRPDGPLLCYEPGVPGDDLGYTPRRYDEIHMYFGGVQAASVDHEGGVDAAYDPRRSGGCALI